MVLSGLNKNLVIREIRDRIFLLLDTMNASILRVVNENNSDFNEASKEIRDNIIPIISNNTIGESLDSLFAAYDLVGDNARNRYLLAKELFAFAESETNINNNVDLTEALKIVNLTIQLFVISIAFDNAVDIDFENTEDLDLIIDQLQSEFDRLLSSNEIDSDTRFSLLNLRTSSMEFFTTLDLKSLTTVTTTTLPSTVISYRYYGDSTRSDEIVSLNKAYNTGFIEGTIKILSSD